MYLYAYVCPYIGTDTRDYHYFNSGSRNLEPSAGRHERIILKSQHLLPKFNFHCVPPKFPVSLDYFAIKAKLER